MFRSTDPQGRVYGCTPGNQDMAVKYRERLYFFSTSEAKAKFSASPELYTAGDGSLEVSLWCETAFTCMQLYNVRSWISVSCFL